MSRFTGRFQWFAVCAIAIALTGRVSAQDKKDAPAATPPPAAKAEGEAKAGDAGTKPGETAKADTKGKKKKKRAPAGEHSTEPAKGSAGHVGATDGNWATCTGEAFTPLALESPELTETEQMTQMAILASKVRQINNEFYTSDLSANAAKKRDAALDEAMKAFEDRLMSKLVIEPRRAANGKLAEVMRELDKANADIEKIKEKSRNNKKVSKEEIDNAFAFRNNLLQLKKNIEDAKKSYNDREKIYKVMGPSLVQNQNQTDQQDQLKRISTNIAINPKYKLTEADLNIIEMRTGSRDPNAGRDFITGFNELNAEGNVKGKFDLLLKAGGKWNASTGWDLRGFKIKDLVEDPENGLKANLELQEAVAYFVSPEAAASLADPKRRTAVITASHVFGPLVRDNPTGKRTKASVWSTGPRDGDRGWVNIVDQSLGSWQRDYNDLKTLAPYASTKGQVQHGSFWDWLESDDENYDARLNQTADRINYDAAMERIGKQTRSMESLGVSPQDRNKLMGASAQVDSEFAERMKLVIKQFDSDIENIEKFTKYGAATIALGVLCPPCAAGSLMFMGMTAGLTIAPTIIKAGYRSASQGGNFFCRARSMLAEQGAETLKETAKWGFIGGLAAPVAAAAGSGQAWTRATLTGLGVGARTAAWASAGVRFGMAHAVDIYFTGDMLKHYPALAGGCAKKIWNQTVYSGIEGYGEDGVSPPLFELCLDTAIQTGFAGLQAKSMYRTGHSIVNESTATAAYLDAHTKGYDAVQKWAADYASKLSPEALANTKRNILYERAQRMAAARQARLAAEGKASGDSGSGDATTPPAPGGAGAGAAAFAITSKIPAPADGAAKADAPKEGVQDAAGHEAAQQPAQGNQPASVSLPVLNPDVPAIKSGVKVENAESLRRAARAKGFTNNQARRFAELYDSHVKAGNKKAAERLGEAMEYLNRDVPEGVDAVAFRAAQEKAVHRMSEVMKENLNPAEVEMMMRDPNVSPEFLNDFTKVVDEVHQARMKDRNLSMDDAFKQTLEKYRQKNDPERKYSIDEIIKCLRKLWTVG